jgi:tetratricopeptide (TPR) repeat protein
VIDGLASLIDKNLVRREGTDDEPRFTMLETIREYARERLAETDERGARCRHAEYLLGLAEELEPVLSGSGGREAQARLLAELDNFRAALRWSIDNGAGALALRLVAALWRFWWDRSLGPESYAWCQAALGAAPDAPPDVRGRALFAAGDAYYARGEWKEYRRMLAEAIPLLEAGGDEEFLLYALWAVGVVDQSEGRHDEADRVARDALARAEAGGYGELIGRINILLGYGAQVRGDTAAALSHFESAAAKFEEIGDSYGRALTLENLAVAAVLGRDPANAARALTESLDIWDFSGNVHNLGHHLVVVAAVAQAYGEAALAARLLGTVTATFARMGVSLQENEARIEREARELAEADLGTDRYVEELKRGERRDLADELPVVMESLRRWATSGSPAESSRPTAR